MKNFTPPGRVVAFPGTFRVFSFLIVAALLLGLAGCSSPASSDSGETGSFTVTFNLNGGTLNYSTNSQVRTLTYSNTELGTDNFPGNPSWNGSGSYTFAGWNTSSSGTGTPLTASTTVRGTSQDNTGLTVYAQWVSTTQPSGSYTVTFRTDSGTATAPWAVKVATGTPATIGSSNFPASPTRKDNTFEGWHINSSSGTSFTSSSTVTANTTVYANWTGTSNNNPSSSAPTGLSASVSGNSINLSWSSVSSAAYYFVYRSSSSSDSYSLINTAYTNSYTDSNLSAGTYYYKVSAVSSSGTESAPSGYSSATVTAGGGSPTSLTIGTSWTTGNLSAGGVKWYSFVATSGSSYNVQWDDNYDGTGQYNCDIKVSAHTSTSSEANIFTATDSGYKNPKSISNRSGTIYLKVEGYSANSNGTYAIRVTQ